MAKITVIGVTESPQTCELSPQAQEALQAADLIFGAERHLQKLSKNCKGEKRSWGNPLSQTLQDIETAHKSGKAIAVLATGDPMFFGIGATLARRFADHLTVMPSVGAFAAAAAALSWASHECAFATLHGRPMASLRRYLAPKAKILILSHDATTPQKIAEFLQAENYHDAIVYVLCDLGGDDEKIHRFDDLSKIGETQFSDLNTVALSLGEGSAPLLPPYMLLRDDDFLHDGQITKEEVRAVTLLRLRPYAGAHLWDVGAGCGSISLSWLLAGGSVTSLEKHKSRCDFIKTNAENWGVQDFISIIEGDFKQADFAAIHKPDAIFCGGGIDSLDSLENLYKHLKNKGIFVINAVTLEACESLNGFHKKHGGELARLQIERTESLGKRQAFKPQRAVLQYWGRKP